MAPPIRTVFLTNVVSPLHAPLLARVSARGRLDLRVLYLNENEESRRWAEDPSVMTYPYEILSRRVRPRGHLPGLRVDRLVRRALAHRPDVLIAGGWNEPEILGTLAATALLRIPAVLVSASTQITSRQGSRVLPALKRFIGRRFAAGIVPGPLQADYLALHGFPRGALFDAPYSVPGDEYRAAARTPRELAGSPRLLLVARLTDEKGVDLLIAALDGLPEGAQLHIVGEGPLEGALRAQAAASRVAGRIHFHGFVPRAELGAWYAGADVCVVPSVTETWGLVVNEAMEVGRPVVASDAVGAAPRLVVPGRTGAMFRSRSVDDLRRALLEVVGDPEEMRRLGREAREQVASCNVDAAAQGWEEAVAFACGRR